MSSDTQPTGPAAAGDLSKKLRQAQATLAAVRKLADRLDGFAAIALLTPDRKLYEALANDVRTALSDPEPAGPEPAPDEPTSDTGSITTPRQPAYDAVYAYIRTLPALPGIDIAQRNAMIWRAVEHALDAEPRPHSRCYSHEVCGFHWHGRDGLDLPMRDGQPVCPRCELERLTREQQPTTTVPTSGRAKQHATPRRGGVHAELEGRTEP